MATSYCYDVISRLQREYGILPYSMSRYEGMSINQLINESTQFQFYTVIHLQIIVIMELDSQVKE